MSKGNCVWICTWIAIFFNGLIIQPAVAINNTTVVADSLQILKPPRKMLLNGFVDFLGHQSSSFVG